MTNEEQKLREIVERWMGKKHPITMQSYVSDLTALISEHYVSREEYDEEKKSNSLLHKAMVTAEKGGHDKAMEEISEHYYPKEFVEWVFREGIGSNDDGTLFHYVSIQIKGHPFKETKELTFNTIDELYQYWKENVR